MATTEQEFLEEEAELQFPAFSNADALRLGEIIVRIAGEESLPVVVDIVRSGQQLYHCALEGTSADNDRWVERKRRVVERFAHSSALIRARLAASGKSIEERYFVDATEYSAFGGSFPIFVRGTGAVGAVTVSGLTQEEDHELAVRGIREYLSLARVTVDQAGTA